MTHKLTKFIFIFLLIITFSGVSKAQHTPSKEETETVIYHRLDSSDLDVIMPIPDPSNTSMQVAQGSLPTVKQNQPPFSQDNEIPTAVNFRHDPNVIINGENRTRVADTTQYPWSAVVQVFFDSPDGTNGGCSGWFIGASTIMTAAHCIWIFDGSTSLGYGSNYRIFPGRDGDFFPFKTCRGIAAVVPSEWANSASADYDWGKIDLNCNEGHITGVLGFRSTAGDIRPLDVTAVGFPGISPDGVDNYASMWQGPGSIQDTTTYRLKFDNDVTPGQSGGVLWQQSFSGCSTPCPIGILSREYPNALVNEAVRITPGMFDLMIEWRKRVYNQIYVPRLLRDPVPATK